MNLKKTFNKHEEIIKYIIVGVLTTIVSIISYAVFRQIMYYNAATVLSWVCAVTFAYFTNRTFVFKSQNQNKKGEFLKFISSRLATLLMEIIFMFIMVDLIKIEDMIAKIIVQFIILVSNYILSKLFVFKK